MYILMSNILIILLPLGVICSLLLVSINPIYAQSSSSGINWGKLCRNSIIDAVVVEPCETLTTPDGYTLTPDGQRVVKCIAGGGLLLLADPTGQALAGAQALGPAVGCGSSSSSSSSSMPSSNNNNLLTGILGLLTRWLRMKLDLAYKNLLVIAIIMVLFTSIVSTQEALAVGLKVNVELSHSNSGLTEVCVSSVDQNLGCRTITLSGLASPYTLTPFIFGENVVPVGGQFEACATNLVNHQNTCVTGTNSPAKVPETVSLTVPSSSGTNLSPSTRTSGINWEILCNQYGGLVGITSPCSEFAQGTVLTQKGQTVLVCLLGGAVTLLATLDPVTKAAIFKAGETFCPK
jgi:hypothetical protein